MAGRLKVDDVRYELNPTTGMLSVWLLFPSAYIILFTGGRLLAKPRHTAHRQHRQHQTQTQDFPEKPSH